MNIWDLDDRKKEAQRRRMIQRLKEKLDELKTDNLLWKKVLMDG